MLVLVLVLEKSEPYDTFARERRQDYVTGDTILQRTISALAEFEGFSSTSTSTSTITKMEYEQAKSKNDTPDRAVGHLEKKVFLCSSVPLCVICGSV